MKTNILDSLNFLPYFTIESVKQLWDKQTLEQGSVRTALYRWMKSGKVIQLKKGVYMTRRFYELRRADPDFSLAVSAILLPQSYVSTETILQRYAVLTEVTYPVSAITIKNTRVIQNDLGVFTYRHVKNNLFTGFTISDYFNIPIARATKAKALFDTLYMRPGIGAAHHRPSNLAEELRLNLEDFSAEEREEFAHYVTESRLPKMMAILKDFRRTVWQP